MTEYSLNGKIEQLQQEVAELREKVVNQFAAVEIANAIVKSGIVPYEDGWFVPKGSSFNLEPVERPEDPVDDDDDSGAIVGGGPGYKAMIEADMDNNCDWEDDNADGVPAQPAPAEGIDVERVMALVKQYGEELSDMSFFKETDPEKLGYFDYHEEIAEKLFAEIRAMLGGAR